MGNYDIPAMIKKVLETTGHEKLFYIGTIIFDKKRFYRCNLYLYSSWLMMHKIANFTVENTGNGVSDLGKFNLNMFC
jgi:hypothetical protein